MSSSVAINMMPNTFPTKSMCEPCCARIIGSKKITKSYMSWFAMKPMTRRTYTSLP